MRRNFPSALLKNMLLLFSLKAPLSLCLFFSLSQPAEPQPKAVKTPESLTDNIKTGRLVAQQETKSQCFDR